MRGGMAKRAALTAALALPLLAISLAFGPAHAQPAEGGDETVQQVEALAERARGLYKEGEFGKAVAVYLEAYKLQPNAAVLYNVAVIYDKKLKEADLAIDFYRRYIGSPDADPAAVQRATARLQTLKAEREAQREAELATLGNDEGQNDPPPPPPPAPRSSTQATAGWVLVGTGLASLTGGAVVGYLASDTADQFSASTNLSEKQDLRDTAETRALVADVLLGVGAVAALTGALLVALDDGPAEGSARLMVGPTLGGGVGVWWGGEL